MKYSIIIKILFVLHAVLVTAVSALAQTDDIQIKGRIMDENEVPVIGAVILVKGSNSGTLSDDDGRFSLAASIGDTLEVNNIGYETKSIVIKAASFLNIVLSEDIAFLDEVVVVGYGSQSKAKLTGAVATVSTSDFKNRPLTDVSLALQGKVTGVQVTQNSGQPGADSGTITVRGIGTLNDSSPLIIIDGFESSFDKVDPKDIESISVLKDAASAAIYGNKAANGVILITTKSGKSGKMTLEYNGYVSVQDVTRYPELLNSVEYMTLYNEACLNSGQQQRYSPEYISHFDGSDLVLYPDRNWADFYFKPALLHNHYLKMNGGSEVMTYSLSLGYLGQNGIVKGTDYEKYSFRANSNSSFFKGKLKVSTNLSGYLGNQSDLVNGTAGTLGRIVQMTPMLNPKLEGLGWTTSFYDDALREAGGHNDMKTMNFNGNIKFNIMPFDGINIEAALNYDQSVQLGQIYAPNVTVYTTFVGSDGSQHVSKNNSMESSIKETSYDFGNFSSYVTFNYSKAIAGRHNLSILAGWQQSQWFNKYHDASRTRLTTNLPSLQMGDPSTQKNSSWETKVNTMSWFGRVGYDYKGRYMLEANIRYDGSSKFASGHKWGLFPSVSAGWRLTEESFMDNVSWLDELKIRGSWGMLGNEKIWSSYAGLDILTIGSSNYTWDESQYTGAATSYVANKDLTWETTTQYNVGIDVILLHTVNFTGDFYVKNTDDILMQLPVSKTFGFTENPWKNAGRMRNTGFEFEIAYSETFARWGLSASANISFNENKILDLKGQSPIINSTTGILLKEGLPINTLYGYEIEGIYQSEQEIHDHLQTFDRNGNVLTSYSGMIAKPGDIRFKDQNGDGIIDLDNDRVALGDPNPDFLFSFNIGVRYSGFDLTAFFQGVYGGQGWSCGQLVSPFFQGYNSAAWLLNRWTPENPNNTYQRVYVDNQRSEIKSEYYVEDLSYLRLKNLELGYTFPKEWARKAGFDGIRIYLSGQNLFTITSYKGFDPERAGVEATNIYSYPLVRTLTAGINITL